MALRLKCRFATRYHLALATEDWLGKLRAHLTTAIASHPEFHTEDGRGTMSSRYSEERFMGPLSLVKNDFVAVIQVSRRFSFRKDRYTATVRYMPEQGRFTTLRDEVSTVETRCRDRKNHRRVSGLVKHVQSGCSRDFVDDWRCPWCGSVICLSFHHGGRVFAVSCPGMHFHRHAETDTPPDWWLDAVTGGWLECG
jgi:hypothetical protein